MKKVNKIYFNWFYTTGPEEGGDCSTYSVDEEKVNRLEYHEPEFSGDQHYCDVFFTDGTSDRIFNLNKIDFEPARNVDTAEIVPDPVKRKEKIFNSSNVEKIEWDVNNLFIYFNNGTVYQYKDVPEEISAEASNAASIGSFLHRRVKGGYRYERIQ